MNHSISFHFSWCAWEITRISIDGDWEMQGGKMKGSKNERLFFAFSCFFSLSLYFFFVLLPDFNIHTFQSSFLVLYSHLLPSHITIYKPFTQRGKTTFADCLLYFSIQEQRLQKQTNSEQTPLLSIHTIRLISLHLEDWRIENECSKKKETWWERRGDSLQSNSNLSSFSLSWWSSRKEIPPSYNLSPESFEGFLIQDGVKNYTNCYPWIYLSFPF